VCCGVFCTGWGHGLHLVVHSVNSQQPNLYLHFSILQSTITHVNYATPVGLLFQRPAANIFPCVRKEVKAYRGRRRLALFVLHIGHHRKLQFVTCLGVSGFKYLLLLFRSVCQVRYRRNVLKWLAVTAVHILCVSLFTDYGIVLLCEQFKSP
jgi:hypothetical protein